MINLKICDIDKVKNETTRDLLQYLMDNEEAIYRMEAKEFIALLTSYVIGFYGTSDDEFIKEAATRMYHTIYGLFKYLQEKEQ